MKIVLALLFTLIGLGGGQAYLGEMKKAYVYGSIFALLPITTPLVLRVFLNSSRDRGLQIGNAYLACMSVIILASILDAVFTAIRLRKSDSPAIQWKRGLFFALAVQLLYTGLKMSGLPLLLLRK